MNRIDSLFGVRCLAVSLLVLVHMKLPTNTSTERFIDHFVGSGANIVTLFFVMSGFVLAWSYHDRRIDSLRDYLRFVVARLVRVYPLYLVTVLVAVVVIYLIFQMVPWRVAAVHLLALQAWFPDPNHVYVFNGPAWFVSALVFLYLFFPPLLSALRRLSSRMLVVVVGGAAAALAVLTGLIAASTDGEVETWLLYRFPPMRIFDFVMAIAVGLLARRHRDIPAAQIVQPLMLVVLLAMMASPALSASPLTWDLAYVLPVLALVWSLAVAPQGLVARVLSHPLLVAGGALSFGVYLWHGPLLSMVPDEYQAASWVFALPSAVVLLTMSFLLASGSLRLIEQPAADWVKGRLDALLPARKQ